MKVKINVNYWVVSLENKDILFEIGYLLKKYIGDSITFCEFTGILDKDNTLKNYNRNGLLRWRKIFFRKEGVDGKKTPGEIEMKLGDFLRFLDYLSYNKGKIDFHKFKKTVIYCMNKHISLSGKKALDFQPTIYRNL